MIKRNVETLLNDRASEELGIISFHDNDKKQHIINIKRDTEVSQIITQYPHLFYIVGKLKNYAAKIYIDECVPPVVSLACPIPFHLQERFNNAINQTQEDGKIEEHEGPAPWIMNTVLAPNDDGPHK